MRIGSGREHVIAQCVSPTGALVGETETWDSVDLVLLLFRPMSFCIFPCWSLSPQYSLNIVPCISTIAAFQGSSVTHLSCLLPLSCSSGGLWSRVRLDVPVPAGSATDSIDGVLAALCESMKPWHCIITAQYSFLWAMMRHDQPSLNRWEELINHFWHWIHYQPIIKHY